MLIFKTTQISQQLLKAKDKLPIKQIPNLPLGIYLPQKTEWSNSTTGPTRKLFFQVLQIEISCNSDLSFIRIC